jgi:hypothetical protein
MAEASSEKRPVGRRRPAMSSEEAEAAYFARRYGLAADQLSARAKLEAAARRLMD